MKKFTRTYAIIHLDALHANIRQAKERVGDNVKIMAIVKADAYGHGAIEVAKAIKDEVYGFAVATAREAIELREHGDKKFFKNKVIFPDEFGDDLLVMF